MFVFLSTMFILLLLCVILSFVRWQGLVALTHLDAQYKYKQSITLPTMADLQIITYNTQGLQGIQKRLDIFDYLKNKKCHIYCLQDTHFTAKDEINIRDQWGSNCLFSNNRSNTRGVAILFGKELDYKIHKSIIDTDGNFIILDLNVYNQKITLVNLYRPNNDKPDFFQHISNYIDETGNSENIICGDFNCVLNPELDYYNYKTINNPKA